MADLRFAIAVLRSGAAYPIRAVPGDETHNALRRLEPGAGSEDEIVWHRDSLDLLNEHAPNAGDHFESEGEPGGAPPLVEANAFPWYAVFEDHDQELWVARFFGPNLPGNGNVPGVHIVEEDPALIDVASLGDDTLSRRSVIILVRDDIGEAVSKSTGDHGGGGGVIRTEW